MMFFPPFRCFQDTELEIQFPVPPGAVMPPQKGCQKAAKWTDFSSRQVGFWSGKHGRCEVSSSCLCFAPKVLDLVFGLSSKELEGDPFVLCWPLKTSSNNELVYWYRFGCREFWMVYWNIRTMILRDPVLGSHGTIWWNHKHVSPAQETHRVYWSHCPSSHDWSSYDIWFNAMIRFSGMIWTISWMGQWMGLNMV